MLIPFRRPEKKPKTGHLASIGMLQIYRPNGTLVFIFASTIQAQNFDRNYSVKVLANEVVHLPFTNVRDIHFFNNPPMEDKIWIDVPEFSEPVSIKVIVKNNRTGEEYSATHLIGY